MTEFDYDYLQEEEAEEKNPRGVGSGRLVMLPSDYLDSAALQRKNGPCRTYRLGRPMGAAEFEDMPGDLQTAYLRRLRLRGGSERDVEQMLGMKPGRLRRYRVRFDQANAEEWNMFLQPCAKEE